MSPSEGYVLFVQTLENLGGAVPGHPGRFTWFFDSAGVATVGYGHALHHPVTGGEIIRAKYGDMAKTLADEAMVKYYGSSDISLEQVQELKVKDLSNFADGISGWIRGPTTPDQFDALLDFAYNCGQSALHTSTLLKMHNYGSKVVPLSIKDLAAKSKAKMPIRSINEAFVAWSDEKGVWALGLFHRRIFELLVYTGMNHKAAYDTAWAYVTTS